MEQWLITHQITVRLISMVVFFAILASWESRSPWRFYFMPRFQRWWEHLWLAIIAKSCVRLVFPVLLVTLALKIEQQQVGLLNRLHWPDALCIGLGVLWLDLILYWQHRLLHKYTWLWRVHRVHHMDRNIDVSTGIRFHPLEEIFSMGAKVLAIAFFGIPPLAVLIFEILFNAALFFTHLNVQLAHEKSLRKWIVTPGMHRIHHSDDLQETHSNYGFCLSWWDKLFGTYVATARAGERKLVLGLADYQDLKCQTWLNMLWSPFNPSHLKSRVYKMKSKIKGE